MASSRASRAGPTGAAFTVKSRLNSSPMSLSPHAAGGRACNRFLSASCIVTTQPNVSTFSIEGTEAGSPTHHLIQSNLGERLVLSIRSANSSSAKRAASGSFGLLMQVQLGILLHRSLPTLRLLTPDMSFMQFPQPWHDSNNQHIHGGFLRLFATETQYLCATSHTASHSHHQPTDPPVLIDVQAKHPFSPAH